MQASLGMKYFMVAFMTCACILAGLSIHSSHYLISKAFFCLLLAGDLYLLDLWWKSLRS